MTREWTTIDKSGWGDGAWQREPDKIQWVDEATGLDCLIVRNPSGGFFCGYVGLPPEHPWHGVEYHGRTPDCTCPEADDDGYYVWCQHTPESRTEVHGGLTYSGSCQEGKPPSEGICHLPEPGRPDNVWWLGFDCTHAGDLRPEPSRFSPPCHGDIYRDRVYVEREVAHLAEQLAAVA